MHRLPGIPAHVVAELVEGGPPSLIARADAVFAAYAVEAPIVDSVKHVDAARAASQRVIATDAGELGVRLIEGNGVGSVVHLHDVGSPSRAPVTSDLAAKTILPDLPGHGASRDWPHDQCSPAAVSRALVAMVDSLGLVDVAIVATGGSCAIGVTLALALGARATHLTLHDPLPLDDFERAQFLSLLPDLTPTSTGSQLLGAWNFARMKYLFWPWLPQDSLSATQTTAPAARRVQADAVEILRAGKCFHALWKGALAIDLGLVLAQLKIPVELLATAEDEPIRLAARLAALAGLELNEAVAQNDERKIWRRR